jgi:hypothetical protein
MASVVLRNHRGRNGFIIVRSLFEYSEYSKLSMFDAQIISSNDLYSFIDKGIPSNEKAMDCDSFSDRLLDERIAPGHKNHAQMSFSRLPQWALAEYICRVYSYRGSRGAVSLCSGPRTSSANPPSFCLQHQVILMIECKA